MYRRLRELRTPPARRVAARRLFAFLCDEGRLVEWRDGLVACRRLDDAPDGSSRRYAETIETPLGRQTVTVAIVADPVAQRLAFEVLDGPVRPHGELVLRAAGTGSDVTYRITYTTRLPVRTPLDRPVFSALVGNVDRSLERLQRVLSAKAVID
jgi:hypothetical protein